MPNLAYKYRMYPDKDQFIFFLKTFGCCRFIWNHMLSDRQEYYKETGKTLHPTPAQYKAEFPFLKEADSLALANVQLNLEKAYVAFFKNPKSGFPRFKSKKKSRKSYTTNNQGGTIAVGEKSIRLPKAGDVRAVIHREVPAGWKLKSATVSMERDGTFYCSVLYECDAAAPPAPVSESMSAVGLDYKSDGLFVDSEGNCADMPHYYRKSQKRLARLQKSLSRKKGSKKGETESNNHKKQARKAAKLCRHTASQRKDFLHKTSAAITKQYDIICVENLDMKAMSNKSFGNGKATLDNGYGMFLHMLEYKQERNSHYFVKVDKFYPSTQLCHACGYRNTLLRGPGALGIRQWTCPECGTAHDRDKNSAINIRNEGLRILISV